MEKPESQQPTETPEHTSDPQKVRDVSAHQTSYYNHLRRIRSTMCSESVKHLPSLCMTKVHVAYVVLPYPIRIMYVRWGRITTTSCVLHWGVLVTVVKAVAKMVASRDSFHSAGSRMPRL